MISHFFESKTTRSLALVLALIMGVALPIKKAEAFGTGISKSINLVMGSVKRAEAMATEAFLFCSLVWALIIIGLIVLGIIAADNYGALGVVDDYIKDSGMIPADVQEHVDNLLAAHWNEWNYKGGDEIGTDTNSPEPLDPNSLAAAEEGSDSSDASSLAADEGPAETTDENGVPTEEPQQTEVGG
jgi:hypothetical protein